MFQISSFVLLVVSQLAFYVSHILNHCSAATTHFRVLLARCFSVLYHQTKNFNPTNSTIFPDGPLVIYRVIVYVFEHLLQKLTVSLPSFVSTQIHDLVFIDTCQSSLDDIDYRVRKTRNQRHKIVRLRNVPTMLSGVDLETFHRAQHQSIFDDPPYHTAGHLFDEESYKGVLLNFGLANILWEQVPSFMKGLHKYQPTVNTDSERVQVKEFNILLRTCIDYDIHNITTNQSNQIRDLFLYVFANSPQFNTMTAHVKYVDHPNYAIIDHPQLRMPIIDKKHFAPKYTRSGYIDPTLTYNCDQSLKNSFYHLMMRVQNRNNILTVQKIKSIIQNALRSNHDPVEIFTRRCFVWSEKQILSVYPPNNTTVDPLWNLPIVDVQKLSWFLHFIPPEMFFYIINVDNSKATTCFTREVKFYQMLRQMLLQLKINIIKFVKEYVEIHNLPPHLKNEYKVTLRDSFKQIMASPAVQLMFMSGSSKVEVIKHVYNTNILRIKENVFKQPNLTRHCKRKSVEASIQRYKQRFEKHLRNQEDVFLDTVQAQDYDINPQRLKGNTTGLLWSLVGLVTGLTLSIATYYCASPAYKYCQDKYVRAHKFVRDAVFAQSVVTPVKRTYDGVRSIISETYNFVTSSQATICPNTQLRFVELTAFINIILGVVKADYDYAMSHVTYLGITRVNLIKDIILMLPGLRRNPDPLFPWIHNGREYQLTIEQLYQLQILQRFPNVTDIMYDRFAANLAHDVVQDDSEGFKMFLKPVAKLMSLVTDGDMGEKEVRDANALYQYMNHKGTFFTEQVDLWKRIVTFICVARWGLDPFNAEMHEYGAQVLKICDFVELNYKKRTELSVNKPLMEEILEVETRARLLMKHAKLSILPSALRTYFVKRFDQLETLSKISYAYMKNTHSRLEPTCIMFTGIPGTGKTTTINFMRESISRILKFALGPQSMYVLNADNAYHEGYCQQPFVYIDDMFKENDVKLRTVQSTNIINMVNKAPYNMPMAFESKGAVFFDSEFIFTSTNCANHGFHNTKWQIGLEDPEAFKRRFHLVVHRSNPADQRGAQFNTYRVDQSIYFPEWLDTTVTSVQLVDMLLQVRKRKAELDAHMTLDENVYTELFGNLSDAFDRYKINQDNERVPQAANHVTNFHIPPPPPLIPVHPTIVPPVDTVQNDVYDSEEDDGPSALEIMEANRSGFTKEPIEMSYQDYFTRFMQITYCDEDTKDPAVISRIKFYSGIFFMIMLMCTLTSIWYFRVKQTPQAASGSYLSDESYKMSRRKTRHHNNRAHAAAMAGPVVSSMNVGTTTTQSDSDNHFLALNNTIAKCCVDFHATAFVKGTEEYIVGSGSGSAGFHYCDGIFFVTAHFIRKYDDFKGCDIQVRMTWLGGSYVVMNPMVFSINGEDCCFFKVSGMRSIPKSLKKYVWRHEEVTELTMGTPMQLVSVTRAGQPNIKTITKAHNTGPLSYNDKYGNTFRTNFSLNYYENTESGESGSLVAVEGQQGCVKIVGFHVCLREQSTTKFGFALAFTQQHLDSAILQANLTTIDQTQDVNDFVPFEPLYLVPNNMAHYPPMQSRLTQSSMFEVLGPAKKKPVHMARFKTDTGEILTPLLIAYKKMRTTHTEPTPVNEEACIDYLFNLYPRPIEDPKLYSYKQAVQGIPGTNSLSINVGTSAGYPYNLRHKKGKTDYVDIIDNEFYLTPDFQEEVQDHEDDLRNGKQITVIWSDLLKDETRSIEKVMQGKTRLFSACPIHYLILVRIYLGAFISYVKSLSNEKPISVGLNVHSIEWFNLYQRLASTAGSVVAGDFENWDGSIPGFIADIVVKFINKWYNDSAVNQRVRVLLCQHMVEAVHICYNTVYQTKGSGPTGNPITSEWNSLIQVVCNFIILTEDFGLFTDEFNMCVYGDDNIMTTVTPGLRCSDFAPHYKRRFNMTYTHFSKKDVDPHDTMFTISYLGRGFAPDDFGHMKAPLEFDKITEMWNWVNGADDDSMILISIADAYFSELAHYPRSVFDEYSAKILKGVEERVPHLRTAILDKKKMYSEYIRRMYHQGPSRVEDKTQSKDENLIEGKFLGENDDALGRATTDPVPTQGVELGDIEDVGPTTEVKLNTTDIQDPYDNPNMETFDFNQSLDRKFNISNVAWTTSQAANTVLASFSFPQVLFNQTYIADKINDFRAFTAAVQIDIRITTSRTLYGKLMLVYYPFVTYYPVGSNTLATYTTPTGIYAKTGHPHILADAAAGDTVSMTVPFSSPFRYLDLYKYGNSEMGLFQLVVFNPLSNSEDAVSSATVVVTASFVNAKVFLPTDTSSGPTFLATSVRDRHLEVTGSEANKHRLGYEAMLSSDVDTVQSGSRTVDKYIGEHVPSASSFDKSRQAHDAIKSKEAVAKAFLTDSRKAVNVPLPSGVKAVSYLFQAANGIIKTAVTGALETAMAVSFIGLSKPTTLNNAMIVTGNSNFNVNNGMGIDTIMKMGVSNENAISVMPNVAGVTADEMAYSYIASMPTMVTQVVMLPSSTPIALATTGTETNLGFLDHLKLQHMCWTGSQKVKIYVTASIFHSVRFVFFLAINSTSDWQVCYHRIVEVQGSTEVDITLPYWSQYIASSMPDSVNTPYSLYVKTLSWSQADNAIENAIYLNVYKAGASDFRVAAPRDVRYILQSAPREDFSADFPPLQGTITGYEQSNLLFGEQLLTLREMCHKMSPHATYASTLINTTALQLVNTTRTTGTYLLGIDMYSIFYRFWRGSVRVKFMQRKNAASFGAITCQLGNSAAPTTYHGAGFGAPTMNSSEGEIPYYSPVLYETTSTASLYPRFFARASAEICYLFKGGGDDFSFHWLIIPPLGSYVDNTSSVPVGYYGYNVFN